MMGWCRRIFNINGCDKNIFELKNRNGSKLKKLCFIIFPISIMNNVKFSKKKRDPQG